VSVSSGFVDFMSGRNSIVTASGPGSPAQVKVFYFSLMAPIVSATAGGAPAHVHPSGGNQPTNTAAFLPFGDSYRGGISLATGWLAGSLGGAERIVVGQLTGPGVISRPGRCPPSQGPPSRQRRLPFQNRPLQFLPLQFLPLQFRPPGPDALPER